MSYCHGYVPRGVRPGTARVLVTELSGSGSINPTPASKPCEDSETRVELYLSPEKLKLLCGTQDLSNVTSLEICVDTQENTLGNFGVYLPGLVQLKMNNSRILSVRDLGTTISQLQVLWMSRCCLQDLSGITTFHRLQELYLSYNNVSDLSQVGMLENLQMLDLEGNDVDDLVQVQYLSLCSKLERLTLDGNPVCLRPNPTSAKMEDYSYRAAVWELVPQLRYLDDVKVEEDRLSCCTTMGEDWDILRNSIRDSISSYPAGEEEMTDSVHSYSRPSSARCPFPSFSGVWAMSSSGTRPHTGSRLMSAIRPGVLSPSGSRSGSAVVEAETSSLTHRAGNIIFCGNPVQAIQAKRQKLRTAPTRSTFTPRDVPIHVPEHTYDLEEPDLTERADLFAELRAWREQHSRRLEAIAKDRLPQILSIQHSDDEEAHCDEEEDGCGALRSDSSDEEHKEEKEYDNQYAASLDSSFQSLSTDLLPRKNVSSDMTRLSLSPKTALSPSPPLKGSTAAVDFKPQGVRARRLHLSRARSQDLPEFSSVQCAFEIGMTARDTDLQMTGNSVPPMARPTPIPHPPLTAGLSERLEHSCVKMDSGEQPGQKCEISKILKRPAITRPHTARAALQKHHQHHILQSCRGSSQTDS